MDSLSVLLDTDYKCLLSNLVPQYILIENDKLGEFLTELGLHIRLNLLHCSKIYSKNGNLEDFTELLINEDVALACLEALANCNLKL